MLQTGKRTQLPIKYYCNGDTIIMCTIKGNSQLKIEKELKQKTRKKETKSKCITSVHRKKKLKKNEEAL